MDVTPDNMETQAYDLDDMLFGGWSMKLNTHPHALYVFFLRWTLDMCAGSEAAQKALDAYMVSLDRNCNTGACIIRYRVADRGVLVTVLGKGVDF